MINLDWLKATDQSACGRVGKSAEIVPTISDCRAHWRFIKLLEMAAGIIFEDSFPLIRGGVGMGIGEFSDAN